LAAFITTICGSGATVIAALATNRLVFAVATSGVYYAVFTGIVTGIARLNGADAATAITWSRVAIVAVFTGVKSTVAARSDNDLFAFVSTGASPHCLIGEFQTFGDPSHI
jgi:hypothetical protein